MSIDGLLRIVGDVLEIDKPDKTDAFFDIGGSSLAGIRILARLEQQYGVRISPSEFLACDELGEVAELIAKYGSDGVPIGDVENRNFTDRRRGKAGLAQQWALDAERLNPNAPPLQFQVAFRLIGPLDMAALSAALHDVHEHHEALRVQFVQEMNHDLLEVCDTNPVLSVEHLSLSNSDWSLRLGEFARKPFPADGTERWRTLVLRHGPEVHTLCIAFDHRTADGWSLGVVLEDLGVAYAAHKEADNSRLPPTGSWMQHAQKEHAELPEVLDQALRYWRPRLPKRFSDYELALSGRSRNPSLSGPRSRKVDLPATAASALDIPGRTTFVIATTALARALGALESRQSVRILTSSANRHHPGHERTVGWFATGVFPTYQLNPDGDWVKDLDEVARESRGALSVGNVPAVYVRRGLWPGSPSGFREDTGIYFAYSEVSEQAFQLDGLEAEPIDTPDRADAPGIQMFLNRSESSSTLTCYFHEGEYAEEVVDNLVSAFFYQLTALTQDS